MLVASGSTFAPCSPTEGPAPSLMAWSSTSLRRDAFTDGSERLTASSVGVVTIVMRRADGSFKAADELVLAEALRPR
jgi:hypothetical protein